MVILISITTHCFIVVTEYSDMIMREDSRLRTKEHTGLWYTP